MKNEYLKEQVINAFARGFEISTSFNFEVVLLVGIFLGTFPGIFPWNKLNLFPGIFPCGNFLGKFKKFYKIGIKKKNKWKIFRRFALLVLQLNPYVTIFTGGFISSLCNDRTAILRGKYRKMNECEYFPNI